MKRFHDKIDDPKDITEYERNYRDGHRNGWDDAFLGLSLHVAKASPLPGYSDGYLKGQNAWNHKRKVNA